MLIDALLEIEENCEPMQYYPISLVMGNKGYDNAYVRAFTAWVSIYVYGTVQRNVSAHGVIPDAERQFLYQSERRIKENRQTVKEENDGRRVYRVARFADFRKGRKSENKKLSKDLW